MQMTYAQNAYTQTMVNTSTTPLDLILLLYDGAIGYLQKAVFNMNEGNISQKVHFMSKSMAIIEELLASLNPEIGGEIAVNLQDLYLYMIKELAVANAQSDIARVKHVERLLKELRSAWSQIK